MDVSKFCDAVRAKDKWMFKILDQNQDLAKKWATEAGIWVPGSAEAESNTKKVLDELKSEARRIRSVDFAISLHSSYQLPARSIPFHAINEQVLKSISYQQQSKYGIRDAGLKDIAGVFVSDGVIPPLLHAELVTELDALAALEPKDFHPGTEGKVQDLIHPSLYPYIAQKTPVHDGVRLPPMRNGQFVTRVHHELGESMMPDPVIYKSKYAWIPSIFRVSDDGKSSCIESYLNGLGPREDFPNLYKLIEELFVCSLPHFERTLNCKLERRDSPSVARWWARGNFRDEDLTRSEWNDLLAKQKQEKDRDRAEKAIKAREVANEMQAEWEKAGSLFPPVDEPVATSFRGCSLKVIVKAANYTLLPGQSYHGTWHIEGMPHERIVASVIYYYSTDALIQDDGLGMRRARDEEADFPSFMDLNRDAFSVALKREPQSQSGQSGVESDDDWDSRYITDNPSSDAEDFESAYVPLGTVPTTHVDSKIGHGTGRIISFPNWIQHKVLGIRNSALNGTKAAHRKILCFFLVRDTDSAEDAVIYPGMRYTGLKDQVVLTTSDVPPQLRGTNLPTLYVLLPWVCSQLTGKRLPPELVEYITEATDLGLTREMAEHHRRAFMEDRKIKVSRENEMWESEYSLCEH